MKGRACLLICVLILGAAVSISAQRLVEIGGPLTPAATARSENFEREPLQGWELAGNARVGRAGQSRGLVCAGGGHGLWVGVSARDFVLTFRYQHGQGRGHVTFCSSGEPPNGQMYELILASGELALVRVVGQQRQTLGGSPYQLRPGQWHNMIVRVANGQIQLIVDGQAAITSRDAQPLPAGFVGFGCLEGGSCAYDDISVAPGGSGAAMQPLAGVIQPPGTVPMQPMIGVVQPTPGGQPPGTVPMQPMTGVVVPTPGVQAPGTVPMQPMVGVPPPAGALSENFERQPLQGWEFGGAQVQPVELGHALVCPGTGHGIWVAASARDFALRFRYRHGQGVGQVVLCAFGEPPQNREYQVMLSQGEMALVRNVQGQPQELGGGQCQLQPGQWYDVVIRIANGQIQVAVGGQTVLTAQDAQPLPAGTFAFGCIEGGGVAYDDITLTPSGGGAGPQPPLGIAQPLPGVAQPGGVQVQPIPGVLQPGPGARSENFETQPLQGWEIGGNVQVAPAGQSRALVCSGPGHGYWLAGAARDFALRFRYQHGQGLGEVILCASGEPPNGRAYHLMLHAGLLGLDRNVGGQRQRLGEAQWAVQPGQWYNIAVQLANGQMQVSMGGQPVLTVQDSQPLPVGAPGFGCMEGGGFAYDDIVLTPAGAAPTLQPLTVATPPGMGPTPTPGMAPAGPPAQPLSAQMQKGGGTVVTALAGGAAGRLQQAGVAQPDALVQRIQSRNQLAALSQSTGVAQDHLLFLAQAAELARIIGPQNIGRQDLLLLARTDIDRPEDLAAYSGRAQQLAGRLGHEAAALGLPAPSMQRVAYWVQAAAQRASRLPGSQQLLPENMAQRGAPIPFRHVSFGNPTEAEMLAQLQGTLPPPMAGAGMPGFAIAKLIHMPFTIQPGQKSYAQEFDATTPGLYRAEVGIARKGGIVELDWFIEKPKVSLQVAPRGRSVAGRFPRIGEQPLTATPVVSGYAPIISGGNQLGQGQYELYFWVNKKDVPLNGKLRLRLVVRRNQNAKPVVKPPIGDPDRDQVTPSAGGPPDPVIRGTAFVTYQKPVRTQYDVSVHVPIYSKAPNKRTYPIHVVEVPLYTVAPLGVIAVRAPSGPSRTPAYRGQRAFKLTARLDPIPNAFKITYLPIGYQWIPGVQPGDEGTLFYPDLLRDGVPVQGDLYHGKGITMVTHSPKNGVQNGVYSLLFGAKHQMLSTRGAVFDRPQTPPTANFGVNVTLSLGGGKIPTRYVAELFFLELSDQGEYGNDDEDNDEGTGEFKIVSTSMLAKSLPPPTPGQIWGPGAQPGSGAQAGIHYTCAGDSYDPWEIPAGQNKRIACFPRRVLWVWAEEELAKYDRLAITFLVMEDDKASWLKAAKELFSILLNFAKTAYNAFKMQWKDALSSLVSAVKGLSSQVDFEAGVDDLMGTPSMITGKPWGWGFMPGESESWFGMTGASDMNKVRNFPVMAQAEFAVPTAGGQSQTVTVPGVSRAHVTGVWANPSTWVTTYVRMKRAAAPYSVGFVQLREFTVSGEMDGAGDPADVYFKIDPYLKSSTPIFGIDLPGGTVPGTYAAAKGVPVKLPDRGRPDYAKSGPPTDLTPNPCTSYRVQIWDYDPDDGNDLVGDVSFTFYHEDFWKNVGVELTSKQEGYSVKYYKDGRFYVGDFTFAPAGVYLQQVKLRVYVYIWDK